MTERLDRFMARANAAYYASHDPFADFTTAPEISQVFGELLGLWCAIVWEQCSRPDPAILAEAGPGRGTLMSDALRAVAQAAPAFRAALRLHFVETSPRLRAIQADRLPGATWHDTVETLPPGPMLFLANEFLDALPIRQFVRRNGAWMERHVANGAFAEFPADDPPASEAPEGAIVERCEPALAIGRALGRRIAADGGAALFIDYGGAQGDTLQAIRGGRPADPLTDPGLADLTALVDFAAIANAARNTGAAVFGPQPQGTFLVALGLFQRTDRLARGKTAAQAAALIEAARRLAEPDRMGRLFNVLAICHPRAPAPPGFEAIPSPA